MKYRWKNRYASGIVRNTSRESRRRSAASRCRSRSADEAGFAPEERVVDGRSAPSRAQRAALLHVAREAFVARPAACTVGRYADVAAPVQLERRAHPRSRSRPRRRPPSSSALRLSTAHEPQKNVAFHRCRCPTARGRRTGCLRSGSRGTCRGCARTDRARRNGAASARARTSGRAGTPPSSFAGTSASARDRSRRSRDVFAVRLRQRAVDVAGLRVAVVVARHVVDAGLARERLEFGALAVVEQIHAQLGRRLSMLCAAKTVGFTTDSGSL